MKTRGIYFEDVVRLAKFLVELTKEGAAYTVKEYADGWMVEITGF